MIGGAIGVAASLYGVGRFDPVALIGAPLVLVVAAWLAAIWLRGAPAARSRSPRCAPIDRHTVISRER
jgi:hypothetical protein